MKTQKIFLTLVVALFMTSCSTTAFYQVYKTMPAIDQSNFADGTQFEDDDISVSYNFWNDGGKFSFVFRNKTDKDIYIDKEACFVIVNGFAQPYYQNRVFTKGKGSVTGVQISAAATNYYRGKSYPQRMQYSESYGVAGYSESSVAYNEEKVVCIPAGTSRIFSEYTINQTIYRDCDLLLYPTPNKIKALKFNSIDSPIKFSNRIAYKIDGSEDEIKMVHSFFVSEITNYPTSKFIETKYDEFCKQKSGFGRKYYVFEAADQFYNRYAKKDSWKH